jgi:hypothetical protein
MARVWLEYEETVRDTIGDTEVVTTMTERRPIHQPRQAPAVHPVEPRPRWPYYTGLMLNTGLFLLSLTLIVWGSLDGLSDNRLAGGGWIIMVVVLMFGMAVSEWKPEVCTCRDHHGLRECP